jgi:site-specific DNA recombinase
MTRSAPSATVRCAIYTRKSSEAGLEQSFNSLHAQREACEAYIKSQRQEGWQALPALFDDGGISGGTLARPGLISLLSDIDAGLIDVVVVYKVDRLSRSLADFVRLVERFDARSVSFVSVTQQFNTASSMGRLTLNVLLSFAQFEREVTGERIRDKIAASKRKGMWMGGVVPLGYRVKDRALVVEPDEASVVRDIFVRYLEFGCVRRLKEHVERTDTVRGGSKGTRGRRPMSRGALYTVLKNPLYVGKIRHKDEVFDGQHEPIVDDDTWRRAQALLAKNRQGKHLRANAKAPSLLAGLVFDSQGDPMVAVHATKGSRRYRYYVSKSVHSGERRNTRGPSRVSAQQLEGLVVSRLLDVLRSDAELLGATSSTGTSADVQKLLVTSGKSLVDRWDTLPPSEQVECISLSIKRIVVNVDGVTVDIQPSGLRRALLGEAETADDGSDGEATHELRVAVTFERRGLETKLVISGAEETRGHPRTVNALRDALEKALAWNEALLSGQVASMSAIAKRDGVTQRYVAHLIKLAFLAPDIMTAIIRGKAPATVSLDRLKKGFPLDWVEQRKALGFPPRSPR